MLKKLFHRLGEKVREVRQDIQGELIKDLGKVWTSPDGKRAFWSAVYDDGWNCAITLGIGHPETNPVKWLYPVTEGCRLDGGYSELVRALSEAVERCRTGGSIEPDPKSRSTTISNGLFNRKLSNLRLVFSHHSESGEIRFFCGEKSGEPVLLVIEDSRDSPSDDLMVDRVLDVFEDGSLGGRSQSSYEWPLPAFTAAVAALRDAEEELKQKSN